MAASSSHATESRGPGRRRIVQPFRLSFEDYNVESEESECSSSSLCDSDGELSESSLDSDTDVLMKEKTKSNKKQRVSSSSKSIQVDKIDQLKWNSLGKRLQRSSLTPLPKIKPSKPKNKKTEISKVSWCFNQFFTQDMLDLITYESNAYAELHHDKYSWAKAIVSKNISSEELKRYLGIRLALGINRCLELKDMYSDSFPFNFITSNVLGRSRYENINSSLHCQGSTQNPEPQSIGELGKYHLISITKVGVLLQRLLDRCLHVKNYVLSRELTLDEMMIRFQGRSDRVYCRQPKPTSMGMKVIAVTDPHGF